VRPLAAALEAKGWSTTTPDLRDAVASPARFASRAVADGRRGDVVIGHSGAGAVLPVVADRAGAAATVFVDAVLPEAGDVHTTSSRFLEMLDRIPTSAGLLAPWHEWWPPDALAELVPDETLRRRIVEEIPRVPRSFYADAVPLPASWQIRPAAYLQLSPAYDEERIRAEGWSWPVGHLTGGHLDVAVDPDRVAGCIAALVAAVA
jgi:hypothetical protein